MNSILILSNKMMDIFRKAAGDAIVLLISACTKTYN